MTPLCELAAKYGTDKLGHYTWFYHQLLNERRSYTHKVVEFGIGTQEAMRHIPDYVPGASLRMWRDYFPLATVYGVDKEHIVGSGFSTFQCDQRNLRSLQATARDISGMIDVFVDDGSHFWEDQLRTASVFLERVTPNGVYIIEDVNDPYDLGEGLMKLGYEFASVIIHPKVAKCFVIHV